MDLTELSRLLENLLRIGTILDVDHQRARCRVKSGKLETEWLPWLEFRAGQTRSWSPPTVGEQCLVLSPSGEAANGVVLYGIYANAHPAPDNRPNTHTTIFPDGATVRYDHAASALTITGIKTALIEASESVTLDTPLTHCTGKLTADDLLTYGNGMTGAGGGNGNTITGPLTHTEGDLTSNGVVLHTHTHTGVYPGGSNTGGPQ